MITPNRQMIGEVLQQLNVEELQKLEELLEVGLSRVLKTKVCLSMLPLYVVSVCWHYNRAMKFLLMWKAFTCFRKKDF
jgi:hypothetical protein